MKLYQNYRQYENYGKYWYRINVAPCVSESYHFRRSVVIASCIKSDILIFPEFLYSRQYEQVLSFKLPLSTDDNSISQYNVICALDYSVNKLANRYFNLLKFSNYCFYFI